MIKVIDLFAGCGGFSSGFIDAGFKVIKAVEFNKNIAITYQHNHNETELIVDDIKNIDNVKYFSLNEAEVIIGGPPCQGFSMAGARIREGFINDERNYLFKHYFNIVKIVQPQIFIIENVKGILTMANGKIFQEIINLFSNRNNFNGNFYSIYYKIIKAKEYGIPQSRERVIIVGVKNKVINFEQILEKTENNIIAKNTDFFNNCSVWDAISNLGRPTENGILENVLPYTNYQRWLSSSNKTITNHMATKHSAKAINRMQRVESGQNFTSLNEDIKSIHSGSYGRLEKDGLASTITTRFDTPSGGKFIHPIENRTLTMREAARIQSFKDEFEFKGTKSSICTQIGNAVPPKLAYFFAELVKEVLKNDDK